MADKNTISEIIHQTRKIEENNHINIKYTSNISSLVNSDDEHPIINKELEAKLNKLHRQINDINQLTSELLNDLARRHN